MKIFFAAATLSVAALLSSAVYSATCCMKACESDMENICSGASNMQDCLKENHDQLSDGCKQYMDVRKQADADAAAERAKEDAEDQDQTSPQNDSNVKH